MTAWYQNTHADAERIKSFKSAPRRHIKTVILSRKNDQIHLVVGNSDKAHFNQIIKSKVRMNRMWFMRCLSEFSMPPDFLRRRDCIGFPGNKMNLNACTNTKAYLFEKKGKITNDWKNWPRYETYKMANAAPEGRHRYSFYTWQMI